MSSIQGTLSGYEGISSFRSYLDLSLNDIEFSTGIPNPLYFTEESAQTPTFDSKTMSLPVYGAYVKKNGNYSLMYNSPPLSEFKNFITIHRLEKYIDSHRASTIFAPINNSMKDMFLLEQTSALTPKDIINFHTLDYILTPVELYNRKLRIQPLLTGQTFLTDGTSIINERDDRTPNRILQSIKTDSGYIYLIEKPLIPYVY